MSKRLAVFAFSRSFVFAATHFGVFEQTIKAAAAAGFGSMIYWNMRLTHSKSVMNHRESGRSEKSGLIYRVGHTRGSIWTSSAAKHLRDLSVAE
jgi:hypothetical protein